MIRLLILGLLFAPTLGFSQVFTRKDTLRGTLSDKRSCFDVHFYNLKVKVDASSNSISGSNSISYAVVTPFKEMQLDLFANMQIDSIVSLRKKLTYIREGDAVFVAFESTQEQKTGQVQVFYHGKPKEALKPPWDGGVVWSKTSLG
ncbi:MAG: M1 family peptidase, partial [Cytophagales bacterium]|nr:M1 family peptidase [Cytophagales bacterium]